MATKMSDSELNDLISRLRKCAAALREEAQTTIYPDRAEQLPEMTRRMDEAISRLETRRAA